MAAQYRERGLPSPGWIRPDKAFNFIIETAMRVFVLGAGASFHAGYPLAAEMGKRLAAWVETLPPDHQYRSWLKQIADLYGALDEFEPKKGS
jgi:hypothetical protein